jgi:hypothetical protein
MNLRTIPLASLALSAILLAPPAAAQQPSRRVGLGVGIESLDGGTIYVPIEVGPSLRIEPQLGFFSFDGERGEDFSETELGVGILFRLGGPPAVRAYVGPRLVVSFVSEDVVVGGQLDERSGTDLRIVGALGGEYFPHPAFSFGVEGQLGVTLVGDLDTDAGPGSDPGGTALHTGAVLFMRIFLF